MHTENSIQTVSARRDDLNTLREHLSIEAYHKLNRASTITQFVGLDLGQRELTGLHQLFMPHIFSYLHDDISFVLEELKDKGLCRDFLTQQGLREEEDHV
ncbi:Derepression protein [Salmonella enterica]|uniref:Derepression protein n=1 Tax=Salmonella enterica TaxID=28901 RepID=UPI0009B0818C|nr:Derepression protein [Salmonella enterica]EAM7731602.1 Derepression protein [Salmonella enterica]EAR8448258.1 Derepression protein [Salmonella enterica]EBG1272261.1 Derepression protein [Salmonella enterica]EBI1091186.1 Derepression protein [Salmonella enterica]ECD2517774.1 Derepression protein [Salmonella enterica subsp. enterica serovar Javiana]